MKALWPQIQDPRYLIRRGCLECSCRRLNMVDIDIGVDMAVVECVRCKRRFIVAGKITWQKSYGLHFRQHTWHGVRPRRRGVIIFARSQEHGYVYY